MKRLMQIGLVASVVTTMFSGLAGGAADAHARGKVETYTSPTFGVTFEYDGRVWSEFLNADADENAGRDMLGLETEEVRGGLIVEVHDEETDAGDCLEELYERGLVPLADDTEPKEDDDGKPIEGASRGTAWAAYDYTSEGNHLSAYLSCQEWGDGEGVAAFLFIVARQDYDDGLELIEPVLDSVDDSNAHVADEDDRDEDESDDDRDREDVDQDDIAGQVANSGVFESPTYGFTVPINTENWEFEEIDFGANSEGASFSGPHGEILDIITLIADGSPLSAYTDYFVESMERQKGIEVEVYVDPDTGDTIERSRRDEVYTLYTFDLDGDECLLYLHAVMSPDGEYVVVVMGISLTSSYYLYEEDIFELLDQIEV